MGVDRNPVVRLPDSCERSGLRIPPREAHRGKPTAAWPADGCGSPTCSAIWSVDVAQDIPVDPVIADGRLYLAGTSLLTYVPPFGGEREFS